MAETKRIVRFMDTDLDGGLKTLMAMKKIKGIGFAISRAACRNAGVDEGKKIGDLSAEELKTLSNAVINPAMPQFMFNRRKDAETGKDIHITRIALDLTTREDINVMKRSKSYKGLRHEAGLPVRGQRTRSSFRTNKTVGVSKKAVKEAKTPKAAPKSTAAKPAAAKPAAKAK